MCIFVHGLEGTDPLQIVFLKTLLYHIASSRNVVAVNFDWGRK